MNRGGRGKWSCVRHCYGAGSLSRFLGDPDRYFCDLTTIYMLLELNLHGLAYRTFPAASSFRRVVTRPFPSFIRPLDTPCELIYGFSY
jgi:hypothetical protein